MKRRNFLTASSAVVGTSLAGCTSFTNDQTNDNSESNTENSVDESQYVYVNENETLAVVNGDPYVDGNEFGGTTGVTGIIENISNIDMDYALIDMTFYDVDDVIINSGFDVTNSLPAGVKWQYDCSYPYTEKYEIWENASITGLEGY